MTLRNCTKCGPKLESEFHRYKTGKKAGRFRSRCKDCTNEDNKAYRATPSGKRAMTRFSLSKYGCTPEQYGNLLERQGGVCAICKGIVTRSLCVDHNHKTGRIRGLLCDRCNPGLGYFLDDPALLAAAIRYLNNCDALDTDNWDEIRG